MSDILRTIAEYTRVRVSEQEKTAPLAEVKRRALSLPRSDAFAFERAVARPGLSLICEIKKASPSKGVISPDFPYMQIAADYAAGGADCISCLTEPKWFQGSDEIFSNVKKAVSMPVLRKDFTVSEYQLWQSKLLGADAVLLIMDLLEEGRAREYFSIADGLGMSVLCECRTAEEIERAQRIGGRLIGINNRNLHDFSVDGGRAGDLKRRVEKGKLFVAESGILSLDDLRRQKQAGADACLVGEFCMRSSDRARLIKEMKNV